MIYPEKRADPGAHRKWVIRTGIPSIDGMFHISEHEATGTRGGIGLSELSTTTSIAIVGPQGTGKSVLAMHFASRYLADCHAAFAHDPPSMPKVCYVSTDMTYEFAEPMVRRFALDIPNRRHVPFSDHQALTDEHGRHRTADWLVPYLPPGASMVAPDVKLKLVECPADQPGDLAAYLLDDAGAGTGSPGDEGAGSPGDEGAGAPGEADAVPLAFVDLASRTAGDDWAFVHRLLGALPERGRDAPRHLIVLDAVEGLETFGGELDSYGEPSLRRARIAKLIRLAAGKCHLVVIVEEATDEVVLPEAFVSDVVFRLQSQDVHGYMRRTLQIEKARGQSTVRGRHPYVIRSGRGSMTGAAQDFDDPRVPSVTNPSREFQSYVELFPSLHYASRSLMSAARGVDDDGTGRAGEEEARRGKREERLPERAGFGIMYLDEMLAEPVGAPRPGSDTRGLPCSTITALIGDAGTQKTGLGIAFLGQAFGVMVEQLRADWEAHKLGSPDSYEECRGIIEGRYAALAGVPVLITTQNETSGALADSFVDRLLRRPGRPLLVLPDPWPRALRDFIAKRTICRRLEIHDMPSAVLFNIIKRALEAGQRVAAGLDPDPLAQGHAPPDTGWRQGESWRVRLVIDDLNTIMDTYLQVKSDPLFLPFLLYYLRREGPTSLIIDTRAGLPDTVTGELFHMDLRALSDFRLYTWSVTEFFGDHRVAIAAIPPIARDHRARVREIKRVMTEQGSRKGQLFVDPVFELYSGLRENRPQLVPLEVRLYGETPACCEYARYLNDIFKRTFRPNLQRSEDPGEVVVSERATDYNLIRDASYLKVDTRLDHTLVTQIDEFWRQGHAGGDLERQYLMENVDPAQPSRQLEIRDPFHTYRDANPGTSGRRWKADYFAVPGFSVSDPRGDGVDRVPYLWDFGFMACRVDAWQRAAAQYPELRQFWESYRAGGAGAADGQNRLTWRAFLGFACDVARHESAAHKQHVPAFDVARPAGESFSCLVLEVWLSEILRTLDRYADNPVAVQLGAKLTEQLGRREWGVQRRDHEGLLDLLSPGARSTPTGVPEGDLPGWSLELYKTWLLLVESLDLEMLADRDPASPDGKGRATAVTVRHWYKTACAVPGQGQDAAGHCFYGRLPGRFTTRGDWFLAVAPESRSYPLASRALDLLCSIRGNMRRLEDGVGLPARRLTGEMEPHRTEASFRTRLATESGEFGTRKYLSYADILALGAGGGGDADPPAPAGERLGWLWRSGLRNYHRHALVWQAWLFRIAGDWAALKEAKTGKESAQPWRSGFKIYDEIDTAPDPSALSDATRNLETFRAFPAACHALRDELRLVDSSTRILHLIPKPEKQHSHAEGTEETEN